MLSQVFVFEVNRQSAAMLCSFIKFVNINVDSFLTEFNALFINHIN